jgi:hypothetical protein
MNKLSGMKYFRENIGVLLFTLLWLSSCQANKKAADGTSDTVTAVFKSQAPQRVDARGMIITSRYHQGQVMLEVEGFPSQYTRYDRAYVLVQPNTQIIGTDGQVLSLVELQPGQNVAVLLRGNGEGNFVGIGVARKLWLEEIIYEEPES